jgi:hypothetical protein
MRSTLVALTLSTLSVFSAPSLATAQTSKVARGTIASIAGPSLTVKVGEQDMKFSVDSKTMVLARGASTKAAHAAAAGKGGPHLNELLQNGQAVAVTYKDMAGGLHATEIKAIAKVSESSSASASANASKTSTGIVKSMGADWITINGRSGPASFDQTFKIDPATRVFAKGASTAAAARGGKAPFTEIIKAGDHVTVLYHLKGDTLLASDVHVTMKASH